MKLRTMSSPRFAMIYRIVPYKRSQKNSGCYHLHEETVSFTVWANGTEKPLKVCSIYLTLHGGPRTELSRLGLVDREIGKHTFRSEIPFGNFGLPFPWKFPFGKKKYIFPFTFHTKFPKFLGEW